MKICIWCRKNDFEVSFLKKAHTFPASLGGKSICENVCDKCNHYFGSPLPNSPSIEVVFKEVFNLSKHILLSYDKSSDKKKHPRYKSEYFNINAKGISIKPRFKLRNDFQEKMGRQFKRAVFKVFLEEREKQRQDALDDRFNFIREFARYDLCDYPIYYFTPKFGAIFYSKPDTISPMIRFTESSDLLDEEFRVFKYGIMSHNFCIPTSRIYDLKIEDYKKHLVKTDHPFGLKLIDIKRVTDIDFTFQFMNDN